MAGSFECPKCGAAYTRERRQVGKAVVCTCGHKFLVPADFEPPRSGDVAGSPPARRPEIPRHRRPPSATPPQSPRRRPNAASAGDSSAEVLPLAEPLEPVVPQPSTRWADPVDPPPDEPLMQAEVIYPDVAYTDTVAPAGLVDSRDLVMTEGAYGGAHGAPLGSAPLPPRPAKNRKKKRTSGGASEGAASFVNGVAYCVLFVLLPGAAIFTLMGLIQYQRLGSIRPRKLPGANRSAPAALSSGPAPSGYPITIWNASKSGGEFRVEYRVDRGPLDASRQYFWVVTDLNGKIEFPVANAVAKPRGALSGKLVAAGSDQFSGPYTTYLEEQAGAARNRVSNDAPVKSEE